MAAVARVVWPELGEGFSDPVAPARFPKLGLRFRNQRWAERIGLGDLDEAAWAAHFGRFEPLPGNLPQPLALRYHGHQFHHYNPQIGDGRGFLFAQVLDPPTGRILDLATKGSGTTPYSRGGDGRLTLQGAVREILAAEMLEARGVTTSKAFSVFETGEPLMRGDEPSPTRSGVLVRLGHSHLRIGTFQRHAHEGRTDRLRKLLDHCLEHYLPEAAREPNPPIAFLRAVCRRSAELCAQWMAAGFVHGVLNTDNLTITGESFDYGPWRFLPRWDPKFTAAYFDEGGLYAFGRQPRQVLWSLLRLAESVRDLIGPLGAEPVMREFDPLYQRALGRRWCARLGVRSRDPELDELLVAATQAFLAESQMDCDRFFHDWHGGLAAKTRALASPAAAKYRGEAFDTWQAVAAQYEPARPDLLDHPLLAAAPISLLIDEVRALWAAIADHDDWSPLERKIAAIRSWGAAIGGEGGTLVG